MPLLSRNSSKTSSRTSIPDAIENENDNLINTTIYLTDNELNSLMKNRNDSEEVNHTMTNPLGRLLLQLGASHNKLLEMNNPNTKLIPLSDICKSFQENCKLNKDEIYTSIQSWESKPN